MGLTIETFTHTFVRDPNPGGEGRLYARYVWEVAPVVHSRIDWFRAACTARGPSWCTRAYGRRICSLSDLCPLLDVTGYLVLGYSQERGMCYWGDEGRAEYARDVARAQADSLADLQALALRLKEANRLRRFAVTRDREAAVLPANPFSLPWEEDI